MAKSGLSCICYDARGHGASKVWNFFIVQFKTSVSSKALSLLPNTLIKIYQGWEDSAEHDQLQFSWPRLGKDMSEVEDLKNHWCPVFADETWPDLSCLFFYKGGGKLWRQGCIGRKQHGRCFCSIRSFAKSWEGFCSTLKSFIFCCYLFDASGERPGLGKTAYCMGGKETSETTAWSSCQGPSDKICNLDNFPWAQNFSQLSFYVFAIQRMSPDTKVFNYVKIKGVSLAGWH